MEKRARNRRASGSDSETRVFRRARIVMSSVGVASVAEGAMIVVLFICRVGLLWGEKYL